MKKIESLTPEQVAKFPEYVARWTDIGLCTMPADRGAAEQAIREMYGAAKLPPPAKIVWCGSPLSSGLTRAIILDKKLLPQIGDAVRASVWASVGDSVWDSVGASVWASVGDSVWASVGDSVWASVRDSVRDSVGDSVWASVGASVWASVRDSVGASVGDSVRASVRDSVGASVRASVGASVRASVGDSVRDSVRASVWDSVGASVRASVRDSVGASVGDSVGASVGDSVYGQHDAAWLAFYKYFHDEIGLTEQTEKLSGLWMLAKSAGWVLPHQNICWVSERHNILERDERGRLHSVSGPACAYPDGWAIYAVHGVRVPADIIEDRQSITVSRIEAETNAEVRRVMIDLYGPKRYLADSGAAVVQELPADHYLVGLRTARLLRKEVPDDEPIIMVDLLNSTPEPDGTVKRYLLRCDPSCYDGEASRNVQAAVASTWRLSNGDLAFKNFRDYSPIFES